MIIQNPDGTYELYSPLLPAAARWLRALLRQAQGGLRESQGDHGQDEPRCREVCPEEAGAVCAVGC